MSEEILHGADVGSIFQNVRGERMSKHVRGDAFVQLGEGGGAAYGVLKGSFHHVMTTADAAGGIEARFARREDPLPFPCLSSPGIFSFQTFREPDTGQLFFAVVLPQLPESAQMRGERQVKRVGEDRGAVLVALAGMDTQLSSRQIQILNAETEQLHETNAAAVHQCRHQARRTIKAVDQLLTFGEREDSRYTTLRI